MKPQFNFRYGITLVVISSLLVVAMTNAAPSVASVSPLVRVIVQSASVGDAAAAVRANSGDVLTEFSIINSVLANVPQNALDHLSQAPGVIRVTVDRQVKAAGNPVDVEFAKAIGVQEVWDTGNLGAGVTVALLDTGIDSTLVNLRRFPGERGNRILAYYDVPSGQLYEAPHLNQSPGDPSGHGSHVAGIVGNSKYERRDNEYRGVAPAANLVAVRVLDETGVGTYADVIQGIEWIVQNKDLYNIRVLNISIYAPVFVPYWADPLNLAVMAAWQEGIVVVTCAGNAGPEPMSIGVPGNTPYVITVGTFTDNYTPNDFGDDYIPPFSATGPTLDAFVKPDVIAPGAHVISLMRRNTYMSSHYPENRVRNYHFRMTGTSMSAAVASGVAALMLSENPALTPDQIKYRMTMTARPQFSEYTGEAAYSIWEQGAGRIWSPDAVFTDIDGVANDGMDLAADLAGQNPEDHYQGLVIFEDETSGFRFFGQGEDSWAGGYNWWLGDYRDWSNGYQDWAGGTTNWSGSFNDWSSAYTSWDQGYNSWAGTYQAWAGGEDSWAGGEDSWAGGEDSWAGGEDSWAGAYTTWAGGYETWIEDGMGWPRSIDDPTWAEAFLNLDNTPTASSSAGINSWVTED